MEDINIPNKLIGFDQLIFQNDIKNKINYLLLMKKRMCKLTMHIIFKKRELIKLNTKNQVVKKPYRCECILSLRRCLRFKIKSCWAWKILCKCTTVWYLLKMSRTGNYDQINKSSSEHLTEISYKNYCPEILKLLW